MQENQNTKKKRLKNKKSGILVMTLFVLVLMIGMFGIVFMTAELSTIGTDYSDMIDLDYSDISYMDSIEVLIYKHEGLIFQHMATEDMTEKAQLQKKAGQIETKIQKIMISFGDNVRGRKYESYYHAIYSDVSGYFQNVDMIFELSKKGDIETAKYYMDHYLLGCINDVNESSESLKNLVSEEMDRKNNTLSKNIAYSRNGVSVVLVFLILVGGFALVCCGRMVQDMVSKDPITGISNMNRAENYMYKLQRKKKFSEYSCILLDIKDFSYINRQNSSQVGDALLEKFASYSQKLLEKGEFVSRRGGDTFLFLVKKSREQEILNSLKVVDLTISVVGEPKQFRLSSRCGIYPIQEEDSVSDVIDCVSMTLNKVKHEGKEDQLIFTKEQYNQILQEKEILEQFKHGIKNKEFVVYYQPKVNAKTKELCGAEALVRWVRDGKMVPPGMFIPILEKEGKVAELDFYVFERVCEDIASWCSQGIEPVRISSNFSKVHLQNKHLSEDILQIIDKYQVDHKYVELELTESSGYEDLAAFNRFIQCMSKEKIHTSMDDFGTGYSSLSMLKEVNVDVVKLDKSFLSGVNEGDVTKEKMISHLVHMIRDLNRLVICEGVETKKELVFLEGVSCDMIQGYYFDKPLPHDEFHKRLLHPLYEVS